MLWQRAGMDSLWKYLLTMFIYGIAGALILGCALAVLIKLWNWITPIDEWEELKKGNMAVAVLMAAVVIAFAIVIASLMTPGHYVPF
jgi:uncharacterized membrane protein YjfL (UPF0719 family)